MYGIFTFKFEKGAVDLLSVVFTVANGGVEVSPANRNESGAAPSA